MSHKVVDVFKPSTILERQYNEKFVLPVDKTEEENNLKNSLQTFHKPDFTTADYLLQRNISKMNDLSAILHGSNVARNRTSLQLIEKEIKRLKYMDVEQYILDSEYLRQRIDNEENNEDIKQKMKDYFSRIVIHANTFRRNYIQLSGLISSFPTKPELDYHQILKSFQEKGYIPIYNIIY